jgi:hypothetical protein
MVGRRLLSWKLGRIFFSLSALFPLCLGIQCKDNKDPEFVFMTFILPISIEPKVVEWGVGDTLWITGAFPDTLLELHSGNYYRLTDFNFKSKVCMARLVDPGLYLSQQPPAIQDFSFVSITGSFTYPGTLCGDFNFIYDQGKYRYRIGVVPHSLGAYNLYFIWPIDLHGLPEEQIDLRPAINLARTPDGTERIPVYEAFYYVINDGNTNFEIFKNSYRATSLEDPSDLNVYTEQKGSFAFRVVE